MTQNCITSSAAVWSVQITMILKCLGKEKLLKAAQCPWPSPELDPQNRISPGWTSQLAGHWWCSCENQLAPNCEPTHLCKLNIHLFGSTRLCINELKTRTMFEEYHEQILSHIPEHIQCIRVLPMGQVHRRRRIMGMLSEIRRRSTFTFDAYWGHGQLDNWASCRYIFVGFPIKRVKFRARYQSKIYTQFTALQILRYCLDKLAEIKAHWENSPNTIFSKLGQSWNVLLVISDLRREVHSTSIPLKSTIS